jgi:hypothetical protein
MVDSLPSDFLEKCSSDERAEVERWWQALQEDSRNDVRVLLDRRHDSLAYIYSPDEEGRPGWRTVPFVNDELPDEDFDAYDDECKLDYFYHLLDDPSFIQDQEVVVRSFAICSLHLSAIEAHERGLIDRSFKCSDCNPNCPIIKFMSGYEKAVLIGYTTHSQRSIWLCKREQSTEQSIGPKCSIDAL